MDDMPQTILMTVICVLLLAVGIFIITIFVTTTDTVSDMTQTYKVTDPSVDQHVNLTYNPAVKPTVEQYNGILWVAVPPTDVEWSGTKLVIVEHEGLQG